MEGVDNMESGILYGIGVGPGDPELMTIKAVNTIKKCNVIAVPGKNATDAVAYNIAVMSVPQIAEKKLVSLEMPMSSDKDVMNKAHNEAVKVIETLLDDGENVGFLVLGDVTIYSTYMYLQNVIKSHGYNTQIISGITSFCAAAATCGISLCQWDESLIIIPSRHQVPDTFEPEKNYVLMKAGGSLPDIRMKIKECQRKAVCIENCGMPDEKIYAGVDNIPDKAGYFSLVIVR